MKFVLESTETRYELFSARQVISYESITLLFMPLIVQIRPINLSLAQYIPQKLFLGLKIDSRNISSLLTKIEVILKFKQSAVYSMEQKNALIIAGNVEPDYCR